jgi:hypothetical protein
MAGGISSEIFVQNIDGAPSRYALFEGLPADLMTFEQIFEKDARWLMGQSLITDVVRFIKDKPLAADIDPNNPTELYVHMPLPTVRDEVSGEEASILCMVPEELREIFLDRLNEAAVTYLGGSGRLMLYGYMNSATTDFTVSRVRADLMRFEQERQARGEGELWEVVANYLGMPTKFDLKVTYPTAGSREF